ncbi:hypothetical protein OG548_30180 [Streptomyces sp. NBC_01356]|uniref:hypothetical protein n=1 Tax=Streptomyces sp. NBC_01356 TaxID=2903836 RepID=UPI002E34F9FE|nr:hypothetical protein [Streptomyces sp. NBC_01356]
MAKYEQGRFVNTLYFSKSETDDLADVAAAAAVIAGAFPEPAGTKALAAALGLISAGAKWAVKKDKALCIKWLSPTSLPIGPSTVSLHDRDV